MPPGNWYEDSKVASRDLDFSALMEGGAGALAPADAAAAMFATGVDEDASASVDNAVYPDGYVSDE